MEVGDLGLRGAFAQVFPDVLEGRVETRGLVGFAAGRVKSIQVNRRQVSLVLGSVSSCFHVGAMTH